MKGIKKTRKREPAKGNKDIYKFYLNKCKEKDKDPQTSSLCRHLWEDCNLLIKEALLEADEVKLPCKVGSLRIQKRIIDYSKVREGQLRINWGETKKLGEKVYYTQDCWYKIFWARKLRNIKGIGLYYFKPCKHLKRDLAKCIKVEKRDFFE